MLISFEDAVTASNLDPNQKYAVYYCDGLFANRAAVAARCPHAKLFGITVGGITGPGIFACDSETGDLNVDQTVRWVENQVGQQVRLICVYANLSRWLNEGLLARVEQVERQHGVKVRKWLAHFTNNPILEFPWVDAEQYADPGPVDRNVALANFFGDATPTPNPIPTPTPPEGTVSITAYQSWLPNQDKPVAGLAVELSDGSVKHIEQQAPGSDWWKNPDGTFNWLGLGNPGK